MTALLSMTAPAPTEGARMILARAEKRLTAMVERRGIDAEVIATCAVYERLYAVAVGPAGEPADDVMALVQATQDPAAVPVLHLLDRVLYPGESLAVRIPREAIR